MSPEKTEIQLQGKSTQSKMLSEGHGDIAAAADMPKERKFLKSSLGRENSIFKLKDPERCI